MERLRRFLESLAYANVWLSLTAGGLSMATLYFVGERSLTGPLAVGVLLPVASMYAVYTFDKVVKWDPVADAANDPARSAFIATFRPYLLGLAGLGAVLGGVLAFLSPGGAKALALFVVPFPIAIAYGTNVLPARFRYRRLKDVTGGKSLTVAATWALTCVTLPLVATGKSPSITMHLALFGWVLARFFVNTVFFDVGDVVGDEAAGTRTIPVVLGAVRTLRLLEFSAVSATIVGLGAAMLSPFRVPAAGCVIANGAFDLWYVREGRKGRDLGFVCDVYADGIGVLTAATVVVCVLFSS